MVRQCLVSVDAYQRRREAQRATEPKPKPAPSKEVADARIAAWLSQK
jgi:hypothetical protein